MSGLHFAERADECPLCEYALAHSHRRFAALGDPLVIGSLFGFALCVCYLLAALIVGAR